MQDLLASNRRIRAAYEGGKADRVPIFPPISWSPRRNILQEKPGGWRGEPDFIKVARLVEEHCDPVPSLGEVRPPAVWAPGSYQRFLEAPAQYIEELPAQKLGNGRNRQMTLLHTPKGDLRYVKEWEDGIETVWDVEKPIKCVEDARRMLSVPYRFDRPDEKAWEPFRQYRAKMGRDFLTGGGVNSMVAMLCGTMPFELLLEWVVTEREVLKALADAWLERVSEKAGYMLEHGVGPFWHFNGVERASPPMMGPKQWAEWVVPYDGKIMRMIRQRIPDAIIHVHCHGRVGTLLDSWIDMGVSSTDPVEPPPQGNIEMGEAKRRVAGRLTLWGNIEFADMEHCTPDQIEDKVRHALEDGGKQHTILFPSATPHERHSGRFTANAVRYIEAGLKYGQW